MSTPEPFRKNDSGATAIEYGLMAGLVGVSMILGAQLAGTGVAALYTLVASLF